MLIARCAAAFVLATLLIGCSRQQTLDNEKLKSASTAIISIASEGGLLAAAAKENRVGPNYARSHPEYLRKQAEDVIKELGEGRPDANAQNHLDRLRHAAIKLMEALNALPTTLSDSRWEQARSQFHDIRQEAEEIRRAF